MCFIGGLFIRFSVLAEIVFAKTIYERRTLHDLVQDGLQAVAVSRSAFGDAIEAGVSAGVSA